MTQITLFMLGACTVLATAYNVGTNAKVRFVDGAMFTGEVIYTKETLGGRKYLVEFTQAPAEKSRQKRPFCPTTLPNRLESSSSETEQPRVNGKMNRIQQTKANQRLMRDEDTDKKTGDECNLYLELGDKKYFIPAGYVDPSAYHKIEMNMQGGLWVAIADGRPKRFGENYAHRWTADWSAGITCFQKSLDNAGNEYGLITYWKKKNSWTVEYWYRDNSQSAWDFKVLYQLSVGEDPSEFTKAYNDAHATKSRAYCNADSTRKDKRLPIFGTRWLPRYKDGTPRVNGTRGDVQIIEQKC